MAKKKYINDYTLTQKETRKGKLKNTVAYTGKFYRFSNRRAAVRYGVLLAILWLIFAAAFVGSAFTRVRENDFFSLIPYAAIMLPLVFYVMSLYSHFILLKKDLFKHDECERGVKRIRVCAAAIGVLAVITMIMEFVYIGISDTLIVEYEVVFVTMMGLCGALSPFAMNAANQIKFDEIENEKGEAVKREVKEREKIYLPQFNEKKPKPVKPPKGKRIK